MARSKSSQRWLHEHFSDQFVKKAQKEGYRSRSAYKLLEIQKKNNLLKRNMNVVDLGAAPGGWSQVVANILQGQGKIFALDILPMEAIPGVEFFQGDFTKESVMDDLLKRTSPNQVDVVLSDIAPNISGISVADQAKSIYLAELVLEFAKSVLADKGTLLVKLFQGEGFDHFLKSLRQSFKSVKVRKPAASRTRSKELYLLAQGYQAHD